MSDDDAKAVCTYPDHDDARRIVESAKENGDVIRLDRIGAVPYLKHTPYRNNRGTVVHKWSCVSYTLKPMPERTLLNHPNIITPTEEYSVGMFTAEWVVKEVAQCRIVKVYDVEDSPFSGGWIGGWCD